MKKYRTFILNAITGIARAIAGVIVLITILAVWASAINLALKVLEISQWFAILVFPAGFILLGFTGLFYQGLISWINSGWEGTEGGYDGLRHESDNY